MLPSSLLGSPPCRASSLPFQTGSTPARSLLTEPRPPCPRPHCPPPASATNPRPPQRPFPTHHLSTTRPTPLPHPAVLGPDPERGGVGGRSSTLPPAGHPPHLSAAPPLPPPGPLARGPPAPLPPRCQSRRGGTCGSAPFSSPRLPSPPPAGERERPRPGGRRRHRGRRAGLPSAVARCEWREEGN